MGFVKSGACPCIIYHEKKSIRLLVHGDDFVVAGHQSDLKWVRKEIEEKYEIKHGMMGPLETQEKEMTILNRKLTWGNCGIIYEADARHAVEVVKALGLEITA